MKTAIVVALALLSSLVHPQQYELCDTVLLIPAWASGQQPFSWEVSQGQQDQGEYIRIHITQVGEYSVTLYSGNVGCINSVVQRFSVDTCTDWSIWIPNAVTIGGVNTSWFPKGYNIVIDSIFIYNRWGELMLESNQEWTPNDGRHPTPLGVYAYEVVFTIPSGIKLKRLGRVTVIS